MQRSISVVPWGYGDLPPMSLCQAASISGDGGPLYLLLMCGKVSRPDAFNPNPAVNGRCSISIMGIADSTMLLVAAKKTQYYRRQTTESLTYENLSRTHVHTTLNLQLHEHSDSYVHASRE